MRVAFLAACGILIGLAPPRRENRSARAALARRAWDSNCFVWNHLGGRCFVAERPGPTGAHPAAPMRKADIHRTRLRDHLPSACVLKPGLIEVSDADLVLLHLLSEFDGTLGAKG